MDRSRRTSGRARGEAGRDPLVEGKGEPQEAPQPGGFAPSKAQHRLLQACIEHRTIDSETLGERMCLSPETVRTHFRTLRRETGLHERFALLLLALEAGLIALPWVTQEE